MKVTVIFDSGAWIEYLSGSEKGEEIRPLVESDEDKITPAVCLLEIKSKCLRESQDPTEYLEFIRDTSAVFSITGDICLLAADIRQKEKLHAMDAIIYAAAKTAGGRLITCDRHFEKLNDVVLF